MIGAIKIALISSRYIKMQTLVKMLKTQKSLEDRVTANIQFGQIILSNTQQHTKLLIKLVEKQFLGYTDIWKKRH